MRPFRVVLVSTAVLALAPAPSHAAWPAGGLRVASPYRINLEGKLVQDGAGSIITLVHNTGHGNWWVVNRVTPDGAYAAGWTADGLGFFDDRASASNLSVVPDDGGGLWHVQHMMGPTSTLDVVLNRATVSATLEPSGQPWNVAATGALEAYPGMDRDGGTGVFVAWWRDFSQLYLQRVASNGAVEAGWPAGGKLLLSAPQASELRPVLLADGLGGVLVLANADAGVTLFRIGASGATPAGWDPYGLQLDFEVASTLTLIRSDASHVFAVWAVGSGGRVVSQRVPIDGSDAPGWPGSPIELFPAALSAGWLEFSPDGAGGLHALCRTPDDGARWQHVDASGALASGFGPGGLSPLDDEAIPDPFSSGASARIFGAAGRDGGLIACWHDGRAGGEGARARWLRADGTPDPGEPLAGRLIAADAAPYTAYVRAALGDGEGGAYVLWSAGADLPYYSTAYLTRAFSSAVLGVGSPQSSALSLAHWPNPARGAITVRLMLPLEGAARLSLHDVAGRLVASREVTGAGEHVERLDDLGGLAPGVYLLTLAHGAETRRVRVAVVR